LRRRHPEADEATLAALLRAWLRERPGAALGDADPATSRRVDRR